MFFDIGAFIPEKFRKNWLEAVEKVKTQDPRDIEIPAIEAQITIERVMPAVVEGRDVEQQAEEENMQLPEQV